MLSKSKLSELRALHSKKMRQKYGKYLIEGQKSVTELIEQKPELIDSIFYKSHLESTFPESILKLGTAIESDIFDEVSQLESNQGVMAIVKMPKVLEFQLDREKWYLLLDAVQDPGNLGTIIRTADWFGFDCILLTKGTVSPFNAKVVQASMGSVFRTQLLENIDLDEIKPYISSDFQMVVADMNGLPLTEFSKNNLKKGGILILGNEGNGVSDEFKKMCSLIVSIPKNKNSNSESLNVAVATGIILNHWAGVIG